MATDITTFYNTVQTMGKLRSPQHAQRWTRAVLQTLGLNLSKPAKKALKNALPEELAQFVSDVWWLFNFRDEEISASYFQERVARRAGNTDLNFAIYPIKAVFGALQGIISADVSRTVADSLSPELRELWQNAPVPVAA